MHSEHASSHTPSVLRIFLRGSLFAALPLSLLALLCGYEALISHTPAARCLHLAGFTAACYGLWLAVRLYLDLLLFDALEEGRTDTAALDLELGLLFGSAFAQKAHTSRSLEHRRQGTRRLLRRFLATLPLSFICFCAAPWL